MRKLLLIFLKKCIPKTTNFYSNFHVFLHFMFSKTKFFVSQSLNSNLTFLAVSVGFEQFVCANVCDINQNRSIIAGTRLQFLF